MYSFDENHYVPVLFTKRAELTALSKLPDDLKAGISPLFVIPPVEIDPDTGKQKKTTTKHIEKIATNLVKNWGLNPAFVDTQFLFDAPLMNGQHPLESIVEDSRKLGLELVPVISNAPSDALLGALAKLSCSEVCLRVNVSDWVDFTPKPLLDQIGLPESSVHLILDRSDDGSPLARKIMATHIIKLENATVWKTVTTLGTSMPDPLPNESQLIEVDRVEVNDHEALRAGSVAAPRKPSYGDYTITSPEPLTDIDPRLIQISAKLKYASETNWIIARGDLFKGHAGRSKGASAFQPVAIRIMQHNAFGNASDGPDEWIRNAAADPSNGGNPETWVRIGVWRHILKTMERLM